MQPDGKQTTECAARGAPPGWRSQASYEAKTWEIRTLRRQLLANGITPDLETYAAPTEGQADG